MPFFSPLQTIDHLPLLNWKDYGSPYPESKQTSQVFNRQRGVGTPSVAGGVEVLYTNHYMQGYDQISTPFGTIEITYAIDRS